MLRIFLTLSLALSLIPSQSRADATAKPAPAKPAPAKVISLELSGQPGATGPLLLSGHDARQQLLVTAKTETGLTLDLTREVRYKIEPKGIAEVDTNGMLVIKGDGKAVIIASLPKGPKTQLPIEVVNTDEVLPVNFANHIVPIFTKAGCNGGGCHGKSGGQNGFKLSLLGFEPTEDYEYLVKEAKARRIFPAAPDRSLLLLKATGTLPHGGGKKLEPDSQDYRLLIRWINQGMPYGKTNDPVLTKIEVHPRERTLPLGASQQLVVMATYSDGRKEDVTRSALFEPNDKNMAKSDAKGLVQLFEQPGDVAVMVRYQSRVSVSRLTIPLGAVVDHLPKTNNFIDDLVFAKLKKLGLPPSELCDDATFIRRVTLDVAGRLPTIPETEAFLADKDGAKRQSLVDRLLQSADYADFFANKWSALLRNKRAEANQSRGTAAFYSWIRDSLFDNKPYDQFVREIVAASGEIGDNPPVAWYRQVKSMNSQVEDTAQLFLGQRLQCAQCHHHPYEKWSQEDYYSLSAFFSQVDRRRGDQPGEEVIFHRRGEAGAENKKTKKQVRPAALGTKMDQLTRDDDPRQLLADWMGSKENPFFAKALANRYWKHFFGRGLVDPEDDMRETNPPSNPELLEALGASFKASGFDLKQMVRTIVGSTTYQLSSVPNAYNAKDKQNFSRYFPKRLPAEVLYDAVNVALKTESHFEGMPVGLHALQLPDNSFNTSSYFLTVFGRPDSSSSCECERSQDASLAQCLHLLNAKEIQEKLAADTGRPAAMAKDDKRSDEEKLKEMYRLLFARDPVAEEFILAKSHLEKLGPDKHRAAYEDVVWALLNTKEFLFNH